MTDTDTRKTARTTLIGIAGREKYERLIASLGAYARDEHPRLRYWHEALFEKLKAATGIEIADFDTARRVVLHCHVHDEPLRFLDGYAGPVQAAQSDAYLQAEDRWFPHSREVTPQPAHMKRGSSPLLLRWLSPGPADVGDDAMK